MSEKLAYTVTEDAGDHVAGAPNPGSGETIMLTPGQAEHPLRVGHLRKPGTQMVLFPEQTPRRRGRKRRGRN